VFTVHMWAEVDKAEQVEVEVMRRSEGKVRMIQPD